MTESFGYMVVEEARNAINLTMGTQIDAQLLSTIPQKQKLERLE